MSTREAAERLLVGTYANDIYGHMQEKDQREVAEAYLSDHLEDDNEMVTEEWWKENVKQNLESDIRLYFLSTSNRIQMTDSITGDSVLLPINTRGQVRTLLKLLEGK